MNKREFNQKSNLFISQDWLLKKVDQLDKLLGSCDTTEDKDLIISLLHRFQYLRSDGLNYLINLLCEELITNSGFSEKTTQLLSLTFDDEADSSQKILDMIKNPIYEKGWRNVKTVNQFGKGIKNFNNGLFQIAIIDEFIGSGITLRSRIKYLKKEVTAKFELKCFFLAGMRESIEELEGEGVDIYCPLRLEKGISGHYSEGQELDDALLKMVRLESKLANKINDKELETYSFGWGKAEALYTLGDNMGNTPNSVFPIFWWLKDVNGNDRSTLLTRVEKGF